MTTILGYVAAAALAIVISLAVTTAALAYMASAWRRR